MEIRHHPSHSPGQGQIQNEVSHRKKQNLYSQGFGRKVKRISRRMPGIIKHRSIKLRKSPNETGGNKGKQFLRKGKADFPVIQIQKINSRRIEDKIRHLTQRMDCSHQRHTSAHCQNRQKNLKRQHGCTALHIFPYRIKA